MRLFFAVDFSDSVRDAIRDGIAALALGPPPWRWIAIENLHLTLRFLGQMPESRVSDLVACAETAFANAEPFTIRLGGLGGFPNVPRARVLFYRVEDGAKRLHSLAQRLDEPLSRVMRIPNDTRPFRSHVTIARVKSRLPHAIVQTLEAAPALSGATQSVRSVVLIQSLLGPKGAKYHHLKEFALTKPR